MLEGEVMPGNQEQNNQNNHVENNNAYLYNPNRPENNTNPNQNPEDHSDTQKVVDTAAKGLANYAAPGVGGAVYDTAKKVPGVGKAIDKTTGAIAEAADQVPGMKNVSKGLNSSGATDAVNKGMGLMGGNPTGAANAQAGAASKASQAANAGKASNTASPASSKTSPNQATPATPMHKNTNFQSMMQTANEESDADTSEYQNPDEDIKEEVPQY